MSLISKQSSHLQRHTSYSAKPLPSLSDGILCQIFQYFSATELLQLSTVCSRWSLLIQNMAKTARFTVDDTLSAIVSTLHEFPHSLHQLELNHLDGNIATVLRKVRLLQSNLQHISIDSCAVVKECNRKSGRRLKALLHGCTELQTVSLINVTFEISPTLEAFAQMPRLRSLTIGNNPCLTSIDLLTLILNCDHLAALHLYRISCLCEEDFQFMFSPGGRLSKQLKELTLDRVEELGPGAFECLLHCKQLQALRINYSTGLAPQTLLRLPDELPRLRRLQLERVCRISSANLVQLFAETADKKLQLSEFGLIDCCTRLTDNALLALAASQSQSLVRLQLRDCVGLRDVSCLFERFRHLREIDLSGCVGLHQPSFASLSSNDKGDTNIITSSVAKQSLGKRASIASMSKIVLPEHWRNAFEMTTLHPLGLSRVTYDDQQVNAEEEVNELDYSTPVCIKF